MTKNEFYSLCQQYLIDPDIALENENITRALAARDDEKVIQLLQEEF